MSTAAEVLTAPTEAQAPNSTPTPVTTPGWWDSTVKSPEAKAWLANKNYADIDILAQSAMSSEKLIGAEKAGRTVVLPKDDKDVEGQKAYYAKIGVPETADGYKLPLPEGDKGEFAKVASTWFHKNGIPAKAAEGIATEWNTYIESQVKAGQEAEKQASERSMLELQGEWGAQFDSRSEMARRGFREVGKQAGLEDADLKSLESAIGTAKMLKVFSRIGEITAESGFAGGSGGEGTFGLTPAAANAKINSFIADRAAGKINDHTWRTEVEPEMTKLLEVVTRKSA